MNFKKIVFLITMLMLAACNETKKSQPNNSTSPDATNPSHAKVTVYSIDEVFEKLIGGKKPACLGISPYVNRDYMISIYYKLKTSTPDDNHWLREDYDFLENGAALIERGFYYSLSGRWKSKAYSVGRWEREENLVKIYDQDEILLSTVTITSTEATPKYDAVFGPEHPLDFVRDQANSDYKNSIVSGGQINFGDFPEQMDFYNQLAADCP